LYRENTNNGGIISGLPGDACNASLYFAAAINVLVNGCTERTPTTVEIISGLPGDACNASLHFAAAINVLVNGFKERTPTTAE